MTTTFPAPTAHGPLTLVTEGVRAVRGTFRMRPGLVISRTMTVISTPEGLVLVNSIRLDAKGEAELTHLGRIAHVVSLSDAHGLDDAYYVKTFGAALWAVPGAHTRSLNSDHTLGQPPDGCPVAGARAILLANPGRLEGALWLPHGHGTLITCDAIQNHCDTVGASFMARVMTPLMGFKGGVIVPKMWRKVHKVGPAEAAAVFAPVVALSFQNLVTAHGPAVCGGADGLVKKAVDTVSA